MPYLLCEDLALIIAGYNNNPNISSNARAIWTIQSKKPALTRQHLGIDSEYPLRLLEADGYDGQPVASVNYRTVERWFELGDSHAFPPMRDIIRFSRFFGLDVYHAAQLAVKGNWEYYKTYIAEGWRTHKGSFIDALDQGSDHRLEKINTEFRRQLAVDAIWTEFELLGNQLTNAGYTPDSFGDLIERLVRMKLHWFANGSPEVDQFAIVQAEAIKVILASTAQQQQNYWIANSSWQMLQREFDELGLQIEGKRLHIADINRQWLRHFGKCELDLKEAEYRLLSAKRRRLVKINEPDLTRVEVDEIVKVDEERESRELEALGGGIIIAQGTPDRTLEGSKPASAEEINAYRKECLKVWRRIVTLTHDDTLRIHDSYDKLTDKQKRILREAFLKATAIDSRELGYPEGHFNHDMRSLEALIMVLERVETILEYAGIDTDISLVVQGKTIADRIVWIEKDMIRIDAEIETAKSRLQLLIMDSETERRQRILENSENWEALKNDLQTETVRLQEEAETLEIELNALFEPAGGEK